jgi:hypothetical protein
MTRQGADVAGWMSSSSPLVVSVTCAAAQPSITFSGQKMIVSADGARKRIYPRIGSVKVLSGQR